MGKATRNRFAREPLAVTTNVAGTRDVKGKAKMSSPLSPVGPRVQTPSTASSGVTTRSAPAPASASAKRGWLSRFASMVNLRRRRSMDVSATSSTASDSSGKERNRSKTLPAESTLVAPSRPTGQATGWRSDSSLATATGTLQAAPPAARYQPVVPHVVAIPTMHALPAGPTALSPSPYMLGRNPAANPGAVGVVGVAQVQQAQRRRGQSTGAIAIPAHSVPQAQHFQQVQRGHAGSLSHGGVGMGVYPGGAVVFPVSAGYPVASASALPPVQGHALPQQQPPALHRSQSHAVHLSTGMPQYLLPDRPPLPDPSQFAPYQVYSSVRPRRVTATSTSSFATAPSRAMSQSSLATGSLAVPVTVARGRQLSLSSQAVAALSSPATTVSEAPSAWATPESHASRRLSGATTASGGTFGPI